MSKGVDIMADKVATTVSYVTSGGLMVSGIAFSEVVAVIGLTLAVATFIVNWFYKQKHLELERMRDE